MVHLERIDLAAGETSLLGTDEAVDLVLAERDRKSGQFLRMIQEDLTARTFGRFFVYRLIILERMRLGFPDIGQYLDPTLPITIHRES